MTDDLRISVLADTVIVDGAKPHGVARFLDDLGRQLPADCLRVYVPAKSGVSLPPHLVGIDAPQMDLPGVPGVSLAHPLAHHRKWIRHQLAAPSHRHVLHASTPGPFGLLARDLAAAQSLPWVGIDHTRFDQYLAILVETTLHQLAGEIHQGAEAFGEPTHPWRPQLNYWLSEPVVEQVGALIQDVNAVRDVPRQPEILAIRRSWFRRFRWWLARWWVPGFRQLEEMKDRIGNVAQRAEAIAESLLPRAIREPHQAGPVARQIADAYLKWFYRDCTLLLARSEAERRRVERLVGRKRTRVLLPGIDVRRFQPGSAAGRGPGFWRSLGLPIEDHSHVALYVGRVRAEKNIDFLRRVAIRVRHGGERRRDHSTAPVHFVLVGAVAEEYQRVVAEEGGGRIHAVGQLEGDMLLASYQSADLFVFPSRTETLGQVLLEAMATELPVLAANEGGPTAIVRLEEQVGKLLPAVTAADEALWAETIHDWLGDRSRRLAMGRAGRRLVCREFSWDVSAQSYLDIHREAIELHRQRKMRSRAARTRTELSQVSLPAPVLGNGMLLLSDYHAGKRARDSAPLAALRDFADANQLGIGLLGDFADHSSDSQQAARDFAVFREQIGAADWFIRGNHDYGFDDEWLSEQLGGTPVHQSYAHVDEQHGIFSTHGHILGLSRELKASLRVTTAAELERRLAPRELDEVLKTAIVAHDISSLSNDLLRDQGLSLLQLWEGGVQWRSLLVRELLSRRDSQAEAVEMLAHLLMPREDFARLSQLAASCHCWLGVYGHTHERDLRERRVGAGRSVLVANCGKLYGSTLSCVVARFPSAHCLSWCEQDRVWKVWRSKTLSADAQQRHLTSATWTAAEPTVASPS